jgi:hypothetical protein
VRRFAEFAGWPWQWSSAQVEAWIAAGGWAHSTVRSYQGGGTGGGLAAQGVVGHVSATRVCSSWCMAGGFAGGRRRCWMWPISRSIRPRRGFPTPEALLRLAGAVLVEAHDEWQTTDRRYLSEATMALLTEPAPQEGSSHPGTDDSQI